MVKSNASSRSEQISSYIGCGVLDDYRKKILDINCDIAIFRENLLWIGSLIDSEYSRKQVEESFEHCYTNIMSIKRSLLMKNSKLVKDSDCTINLLINCLEYMLQICEKCRNLIKTIPIPLSRNSNYLSNTSLPEAFEIFYAHNLSLRESLSPLHIKEHTNKSPILTDNNNNNFNHDDSMNKNVINANAKSRLSTNLQYNSFTLLNILKE
ncbi:unnamed protein product [Gordionus sp. m RMFG-2023]